MVPKFPYESFPVITGIGEMTILAVSRAGFMTFLVSRNELVVREVEQGAGAIY